MDLSISKPLLSTIFFMDEWSDLFSRKDQIQHTNVLAAVFKSPFSPEFECVNSKCNIDFKWSFGQFWKLKWQIFTELHWSLRMTREVLLLSRSRLSASVHESRNVWWSNNTPFYRLYRLYLWFLSPSDTKTWSPAVTTLLYSNNLSETLLWNSHIIQTEDTNVYSLQM